MSTFFMLVILFVSHTAFAATDTTIARLTKMKCPMIGDCALTPLFSNYINKKGVSAAADIFIRLPVELQARALESGFENNGERTLYTELFQRDPSLGVQVIQQIVREHQALRSSHPYFMLSFFKSRLSTEQKQQYDGALKKSFPALYQQMASYESGHQKPRGRSAASYTK